MFARGVQASKQKHYRSLSIPSIIIVKQLDKQEFEGMLKMKMPDKIEDIMLAPCGMNCTVCYKHIGIRKRVEPCVGCLKDDLSKP